MKLWKGAMPAILIAAAAGGILVAGRDHPTPTIAYTELYTLIGEGKVAKLTLTGPAVTGTLKQDEKVGAVTLRTFQSELPQQEDRELLPLLRQQKVEVAVESEHAGLFAQAASSFLPWLLIMGGWFWLSRRTQRGGPGGMLSMGLPARSHRFERQDALRVRFDDVAGLTAAKRDLREVVDFLREPERFRRLGGKLPRGVLLVGPPGTGKTLLARAVAGEAEVPFFYVNGSEFIQLFVGVGAQRVRELFDEAKKASPSIIFIDEIDAVGRSRGTGMGGGNDEREQTLNQLLAELDGFNRNDLTVVIAATNRPDVLDAALLRPGRFDRRVVVDRPESKARESILRVHTKVMPLAPDVSLDELAAGTPGFSGADLANLCNEAALIATREKREGLRPGHGQDRPRRPPRHAPRSGGEAPRGRPRVGPRGRRSLHARGRGAPARLHPPERLRARRDAADLRAGSPPRHAAAHRGQATRAHGRVRRGGPSARQRLLGVRK